MEPVNKKDLLEMTGIIVAGILSNPVNGNLGTDQYQQQQLIQMTFQNVVTSFSSLGVPLEDTSCLL